MIPVRTKKAVRKPLPTVGGMPINIHFDKQKKEPAMKVGEDLIGMREVDWTAVKTNFIYNDKIYELHSDRQNNIWRGICYYPKSLPIHVKKEDCVLVSKNEPILKMYYGTAQQLIRILEKPFTKTNPDAMAIYELNNVFKLTKKLILEGFSK